MIPVAVRASPLDLGRGLALVPPGTTLDAIVRGAVPARWLGQAQARLGGHVVPADRWRLVRPRDGVTVEITVVPAGGGLGMRALLTVGVIGLAAALGPAGFAIGPFGGALAMGVVSTVGLLAVNTLVPPPQPELAAGRRGSPTYSLEGARNTARPLAPVPIVLGRHRMTPPLAAATVSEIAGDDVYLRMLVTWGHGPITLEDLRIGETPLDAYGGVEVEHDLGTVGEPPSVALYSDDIAQETIGEELTQAGGWVSRTTAPDADEIAVDIVYPKGLIRYSNNGKDIDSRAVEIEIQHRAVGEADWTSRPNLLTAGKTHSAIRRSVRWTVAHGQHEVRLRRITNDTPQDRITTDSVWAALRGITHRSPVAEPSVAVTALRILASHQLSGTVDELNGVVTSICPDWDGAAWGPAPTRNPAALYRWVLQGPAALRPVADEDIDLDQLAYWHDYCQARGYSCDLVVDWEATRDEVLAIVAACGRAVPSRPDGRWSVAIDEPRELVVQDFTPRSIEGLSQQRIYIDEAHALRVRFFNGSAGWRLDERVVYADGHDVDSATRIEDLELPGITDPALVHHFARLALGRARHQQERTELAVDWRNLIAVPGDLIRVAHDSVLWGSGWGRIKAVELDGEGGGVALELDETVTLAAGRDYVARVQRADGSGVSVALQTHVGEQARLVLAAPLAAAELPTPGDQVIVGETGREAQILQVIGRQGRSDLAATLTCVPYVDLSGIDDEPIPPFESLITPPVGADVPLIAGIRAVPGSAWRLGGGAVVARVLVSLWSDGAARWSGVERVELRWREVDAGAPWADLTGAADTTEIPIEGVALGAVIEVQARWRLRSSAAGAWSVASRHTVEAAGFAPPSVAAIWVDGEHLVWREVDSAGDVVGYRVRYAQSSGAAWEAAVPAHDGLMTQSRLRLAQLPGTAVELLVVAETVVGLRSPVPARTAWVPDEPDGWLPLLTASAAADGWVGAAEGGAVLPDGSLASIDEAAAFPVPAGPAWADPDGAAFATAFAAVTYFREHLVPAELALDEDRAAAILPGDALAVEIDAAPGTEWHLDYRVRWWGLIGEPFSTGEYFVDGTGFVASTDALYLPWPGRIKAEAGGIVTFRLRFVGRVHDMRITLAGRIRRKTLAAAEIPIDGLTLALPASARLLDGIVATPLVAGTIVHVASLDPFAGPHLLAQDMAGQPVAATATAIVEYA